MTSAQALMMRGLIAAMTALAERLESALDEMPTEPIAALVAESAVCLRALAVRLVDGVLVAEGERMKRMGKLP